jgi:hypothetical protein
MASGWEVSPRWRRPLASHVLPFELGSLKCEEKTLQMPRRSLVQSDNDAVERAAGGDA